MAVPRFHDLAAELVAHDGSRWYQPHLVHLQVAVADPTSRDPEHELTGLRCRVRDGLDGELPVLRVRRRPSWESPRREQQDYPILAWLEKAIRASRAGTSADLQRRAAHCSSAFSSLPEWQAPGPSHSE